MKYTYRNLTTEIFHNPTERVLKTEDGVQLASGWYWWDDIPGVEPVPDDCMGPFQSPYDATKDIDHAIDALLELKL